MKRTAIILTVVVALAGCTASNSVNTSSGTGNKPALQGGKSIPEFDLVRLDGGSVKSADLKGKVTVIDFWATWCESCIPEIPGYNELRKKYAGKGADILGFTMDSGSPEEIKPKADEFKIEYPLVLGDDKVAEEFATDANVMRIVEFVRAGKSRRLMPPRRAGAQRESEG